MGSVPTRMMPPATVPEVDLASYSGRWYQIGFLPSWFQPAGSQCSTTADYKLLENGQLQIINRTTDLATGTERSVTGVAFQDPVYRQQGRLLVQFQPSESQPVVAPFPQPYWIIQLADDYRYAVVSSPDRSMLWILAREPRMGQEQLRIILTRLIEHQGFTHGDLKRLEWTLSGNSSA